MPQRPHLFANVAAATALAIAVAGGGAAVGAGLAKNSVGSAQIKKNAVKSSDVKDDALTGADVKESSLGKVPAAATVDTVRRVSIALTDAQPARVVATKGPFVVTFACVYDSVGSFQTSAYISIKTTQNDGALDSVNYGMDGDFDTADGIRYLGIASGNNSVDHVDFAALSSTGQFLKVEGMLTARGSNCRAELVLIS